MNPAAPSLRPYFTTCAAIFAPLVLVLLALGYHQGFLLEKATTTKKEAAASASGADMAETLSREFQTLADRVLPSVVRVHTSIEKQYKRVVLDPSMQPQTQPDAEYDTQPGIGSGVIVSEEGHILTNWHVIKDLDLAGGRDSLFVALHRETELRQVDVIGVDPTTDVVVLKLRGKVDRALPALTFGDSDLMHRGNIVMALGSPFGLWDTVTQGILSNCERRLGDSDAGQQYLQTDCVINPGNSGGPLVNLQGEIIGINWAVYSGQLDVRTWQGVGLAIRSNDAKAALDKILHNSGPRSYVGLMLDEQRNAAQDTSKVIISGVVGGSPAHLAGLRQGDIIEKIDDQVMTSAAEAWKRVQRKKVGEVISFLITRDGQTQPPLEMRVLDMEQASPEPPQIVDLTTLLGLKVKNGDPKEWFLLKTRGWVHGARFVLVTEVAADSPLFGKVRRGDVLAAIGQDPQFLPRLNNTDELEKSLSKWTAGSSLSLSFWRDPQTHFDQQLRR